VTDIRRPSQFDLQALRNARVVRPITPSRAEYAPVSAEPVLDSVDWVDGSRYDGNRHGYWSRRD
jgi:hypothetical protein